jgi:hypothetical protein
MMIVVHKEHNDYVPQICHDLITIPFPIMAPLTVEAIRLVTQRQWREAS